MVNRFVKTTILKEFNKEKQYDCDNYRQTVTQSSCATYENVGNYSGQSLLIISESFEKAYVYIILETIYSQN